MKGLLLALAVGLLALQPACKELNDHPKPETPSLKVDIAQLQRQMGYVSVPQSAQGSFTHQSDGASTQVKSLVIGALVVTAQNTPYSATTAITEQVSTNIKNDLTNSIVYFHLTQLPTSLTYLEFDIPPPTAGQWQIMAVGLRTQPAALGNLGDAEHKDAPVYYGFDDKFNSYDSVSETPFSLTLKRACLVKSPPKGCASYPDSLTGEPVVTAEVTLTGVKLNGADYTSATVAFPIQANTAAEATAAVSHLKTIRSEIQAAGTAINSLTVVTVHPSSSVESASCQAGTQAACATQEYTVSY